jgi:hypothetical protein
MVPVKVAAVTIADLYRLADRTASGGRTPGMLSRIRYNPVLAVR